MIRFVVALGCVIAVAGCNPTCKEACKHALKCGLDSPRVSEKECENACTYQEQLYGTWGDEEKQKEFADEKQCVATSTCDELAAGACYQDDMFAF